MNISGSPRARVFYVTENCWTKLEGWSADPRETSLTAAITLARQMDQDQIVVVQETEYTGAGKTRNAQLSFARVKTVLKSAAATRRNVPGKKHCPSDGSTRFGASRRT
jgi:cystathionine beta-synthase